MKVKKKFLIHFGLAKTATTYLQKIIFRKNKSINYIGKPFWNYKKCISNSIKSIIKNEQIIYPFDSFLKYENNFRNDTLIKSSKEILITKKQINLCSHPNKINIFSHEGYLRPTRYDPKFFNLEKSLTNMKILFDENSEIDILITLRDRKSLMKSYTKHFWQEFTYYNLNKVDIESEIKNRNSDGWKYWYSYFDYQNLIFHLENIFGKNKIHILNYEKFTKDKNTLNIILDNISPGTHLKFSNKKLNSTNDKVLKKKFDQNLFAYLERLDDLDIDQYYN